MEKSVFVDLALISSSTLEFFIEGLMKFFYPSKYQQKYILEFFELFKFFLRYRKIEMKKFRKIFISERSYFSEKYATYFGFLFQWIQPRWCYFPLFRSNNFCFFPINSESWIAFSLISDFVFPFAQFQIFIAQILFQIIYFLINFLRFFSKSVSLHF